MSTLPTPTQHLSPVEIIQLIGICFGIVVSLYEIVGFVSGTNRPRTVLQIVATMVGFIVYKCTGYVWMNSLNRSETKYRKEIINHLTKNDENIKLVDVIRRSTTIRSRTDTMRRCLENRARRGTLDGLFVKMPKNQTVLEIIDTGSDIKSESDATPSRNAVLMHYLQK